MWARAVWEEGNPKQEYSDAVPLAWIRDKILFWPNNDVPKQFKAQAKPKEDWLQFKVLQVKFTTESLARAKEDNVDTAPEESASGACSSKRVHTSNYNSDYLLFSAIDDNPIETDDTELHVQPASKKAVPNFPQKLHTDIKNRTQKKFLLKQAKKNQKGKLKTYSKKQNVKTKISPEQKTVVASCSATRFQEDESLNCNIEETDTANVTASYSPFDFDMDDEIDFDQNPGFIHSTPLRPQVSLCKSTTASSATGTTIRRITPSASTQKTATSATSPFRVLHNTTTASSATGTTIRRITPSASTSKTTSATSQFRVLPNTLEGSSSASEVRQNEPSLASLHQATLQNGKLLKKFVGELSDLKQLVNNQEQIDVGFTMDQCESRAELVDLEKSLHKNDAKKRAMLLLFRKIGGCDTADRVKRIMRRLVTTSLKTRMSMCGQKDDKYAFGETRLCKLVVQSVLMCQEKVCEQDVECALTNNMKYAKKHLK